MLLDALSASLDTGRVVVLDAQCIMGDGGDVLYKGPYSFRIELDVGESMGNINI